MEITQNVLEEIEVLAGLFMTPKAIAIIIEMDYDDFMDALEDESSDIHKRYYKGAYVAEATLRKSVIKLANQGSSPAQEMARKYVEKQRDSEI
ncbi:hypothetical protein [Runella limosa]|uniref:hypothetical protein n=1 Tax=Runella limosa TaxID=370978 RepID=UPI00041319DA|nr:hypothetical protein [Runella limosa]